MARTIAKTNTYMVASAPSLISTDPMRTPRLLNRPSPPYPRIPAHAGYVIEIESRSRVWLISCLDPCA